ncbi:PKD domain-containing protein [Dyadobacter fanqingshengii]|uniref:PKD domain-containing protein n=1 Tax=Dyadobacter fanqingshengii TaxID=2906443 RepID=A0A9X1P802_9BACT|nr:PKD domain-containing protein [Dyadobacter fanqingshengii]MCF0040061.1 PKD domain-containing protein [Dyadobacter fanqingshengii]USJ38187.1 PKD domain-containing protein [Dyadobacter fanqingshengii]
MISKISLICIALLTVACSMQEPGAPKADFETSTADCQAPCQVDFKDLSENKGVYNWKYDWAFKDSTSFSSDQNPVFKFTKAGKYQVVLTISNAKYGSDSAEKTITITAPIAPVAQFSFTGNNCQAPCEISFTNLSTNAKTYKWEFGDSSAINTDQTPKHTFNKAGAYKVILTALNETVSDTAVKIVTILAVSKAPEAEFDIVAKDTTRSDSTVFSFINKSKNATSYLWDFGDKIQIATASPTHAFPRTNKDVTYTVSLSAISGSQVNKKTKTLTVKKK